MVVLEEAQKTMRTSVEIMVMELATRKEVFMSFVQLRASQ